MSNHKVVRFSISLEPSLLEAMDTRFIKQGYTSRSELVHTSTQTAVLVIVYDHHQRELNQKIIDLGHNASHNGLEILCTTHIHIDTHNCLETIILRGMGRQIQQFSLDMAGLRGVKFSKL